MQPPPHSSLRSSRLLANLASCGGCWCRHRPVLGPRGHPPGVASHYAAALRIELDRYLVALHAGAHDGHGRIGVPGQVS